MGWSETIRAAIVSAPLMTVTGSTLVIAPAPRRRAARAPGPYGRLFALPGTRAFTVLGGYMTAALAPRAPMIHVVILGTIGALAATAGAVSTWNAGPEFGPHWYPVLLVVTALPCVWAGGVLRMRRQRAM